MVSDGLQEPLSTKPITLSRLLLVEGQSAFQFFKALLKQLSLLDEIEIRNYGGISDLPSYLKTLPAIDGFPGVTSLGIVRDAEADAGAAFASVREALAKAQSGAMRDPQLPGWSIPAQPVLRTPAVPSVSVFILPDCVNPGMLETLCLVSLEQDPAKLCVDDYFTCLSDRGVSPPGNLAKARLHALLSSRPNPECLLGQAAHAGYFPWSSPVFNTIKQFLMAL